MSCSRIYNDYDGVQHDYTRKQGLVWQQVVLPDMAPAEWTNREVLWNAVEKAEKTKDSRLAREFVVALPVELGRDEWIALLTDFIQINFVAEGMCADVCIHDTDGHNPHAHIMLTIRPLKPDGRWGPKCRKVYDLDSQGNRIPDGKGGWKNHREDTTDWNNRENAEKWRAAWAAYTNRALEAAGRPERIDHRSYKRQGVDEIPTVHMGPAASQMERRGIQTEKGNINREIAADNKLLKEIKARITRLYNWSKEQSTQPQGRESIMDFLFQARQDTAPTSRYGKVKVLQADAKLFNFLMENGIKSMQELFDKVAAMNGDYYDLRGKIVSKERRISALTERLEMRAQYQKYKPVRQKLDKVAPGKREQFEQRHSADLALFDAAVRYLDTLKASGEKITPKAWRAEAVRLTAEKEADYLKMRNMREDIKAVETLKKTAERLAREGQTQRREEQER